MKSNEREKTPLKLVLVLLCISLALNRFRNSSTARTLVIPIPRLDKEEGNASSRSSVFKQNCNDSRRIAKARMFTDILPSVRCRSVETITNRQVLHEHLKTGSSPDILPCIQSSGSKWQPIKYARCVGINGPLVAVRYYKAQVITFRWVSPH